MSALAAECRLFMPKISRQQMIANQLARENARRERDFQNRALINATYGIGQFIMTILGLQDIKRDALPFPKR